MLTQKDINALVDRFKLIFTTKDDLSRFVTKADLQAMEKRQDQKFATKDDIRDIVDEVVDEKLKLFPTKEEYFSRMDNLSGELKAVRESQELHANDHVRINDRLDRIEHHLALPPVD